MIPITLMVDVGLDWEMDNLPGERVNELRQECVWMHATCVAGTLEQRRSSWLLNKQETGDLEAAKIASGVSFNEPEWRIK